MNEQLSQEKKIKFIKKLRLNSYKKETEIRTISISLASPQEILRWAERTLPNGKIIGKVTNANTLHYKTFKPQKGGLFCERIFGPLKDFECACGKIQKSPQGLAQTTFSKVTPIHETKTEQRSVMTQTTRLNLIKKTLFKRQEQDRPQNTPEDSLDVKGSLTQSQLFSTKAAGLKKYVTRKYCQNCDVEYTWSIFRRYQLGYIQLTLPVTHVWYLKGTTSLLGNLLGFKKKVIISITYNSETTVLETSQKSTQMNHVMRASSPLSIFKSWERLISAEGFSKTSSKTRTFLSPNVGKQEIGTIACSSRETNTAAVATAEHKQPKRLKSWRVPAAAKNFTESTQLLSNEEKSTISFYIVYKKIIKKKPVGVAKKFWRIIYKKALDKAFKKAEKIILFLLYYSSANRKNLRRSGAALTHNTGRASEKIITQATNMFMTFTKKNTVHGAAFTGSFFDFLYYLYTANFSTRYLDDCKLKTNQAEHNNFYIAKLANKIQFIKKKKCWLPVTTKPDAKKSWFVATTDQSVPARAKPDTELKKSQQAPESLILFHNLVNTLAALVVLFFRESPAGLKQLSEPLSKVNFKNLSEPIQRTKLSGYEFLPARQSPAEKPSVSAKKNSIKHCQDSDMNIQTSIRMLHNLAIKILNQSELPGGRLDTPGLPDVSQDTLLPPPVFAVASLGLSPHPNSVGDAFDMQSSMQQAFKGFFYCLKGQAETTFYQKASLHNPTEVLNNFYQFSFIHRWYDSYSFQSILLYVSSPTNFDDKAISSYVYRSSSSNIFEASFVSSDHEEKKIISGGGWQASQPFLSNSTNFGNTAATDPSFSGAGLLQKILFNFNITEVLIQNLTDLKRLPEKIFEIQKKIRDYKQSGESMTFTSTFDKSFRNTETGIFNAFFILKSKFSPVVNLRRTNTGAKTKKTDLPTRRFLQKRQNDLTRITEIRKQENTHFCFLIKNGNDDAKLKNLRKKLTVLKQLKPKLIRRIKLLQLFEKKKTEPDSMILRMLPVLPADLRPIMKLGDQIAASDLNRLYQRIIYRNDRLKKFLRESVTTNSEVTRFAHRLLQEAVDNLIENGKSGVKPETDSRGRALKSLSAILKGKGGRFRQYLLGKRVDYSGRSVIVVGPKLKIQECGLPHDMAIELFLPFLLKRILNYNLAQTVVGAKTLIRTNKQLTQELLREVMRVTPVLLNRAPTLHRLGIQAFQPKLVDGKAIILHPLVCPAFNADFDGDQMAVHIPITVEARAEALKLMFSRNNLLSPATGDPLVLPSQDMVLGCYYLTTEKLSKQKSMATVVSKRDILHVKSSMPLAEQRALFLQVTDVTSSRDVWNSKAVRQHEYVQLVTNGVGEAQEDQAKLYFNSFEDVLKKYNQKLICREELTAAISTQTLLEPCKTLHSNIWLKWDFTKNIETGAEHEQPVEIRINLFGFRQEIYAKIFRNYDSLNNLMTQYIKTTPGKIMFNLLIEKSLELKKK